MVLRKAGTGSGSWKIMEHSLHLKIRLKNLMNRSGKDGLEVFDDRSYPHLIRVIHYKILIL